MKELIWLIFPPIFLGSQVAHAGGIIDVNYGSFPSFRADPWNTEIVLKLGDASYYRRSTPAWAPVDSTSAITGEMRIYYNSALFSQFFSEPLTLSSDPVFGVDLSGVNIPQLTNIGLIFTQLTNRRFFFTWRDTLTNPESVFTYNRYNGAQLDSCFEYSSDFCTNFDRGNSRIRGRLPGSIEAGQYVTLDMGEIMTYDRGDGRLETDPEHNLFNNIDPIDIDPNNDFLSAVNFIRNIRSSGPIDPSLINSGFDISLTMLTDEPDYGDRTISYSGTYTLHLTTADAVVPVPAAIWLMASGLLGLGAVARKRA